MVPYLCTGGRGRVGDPLRSKDPNPHYTKEISFEKLNFWASKSFFAHIFLDLVSIISLTLMCR